MQRSNREFAGEKRIDNIVSARNLGRVAWRQMFRPMQKPHHWSERPLGPELLQRPLLAPFLANVDNPGPGPAVRRAPPVAIVLRPVGAG
jgi:hypothetical protein